MVDSYLGEIRPFAGTQPPAQWVFCLGQTLKLADYPALYSVIGKVYGGDGVTTFRLPDLQGRIPIGAGAGTDLTPRALGQTGGTETVTLEAAEIPVHTHQLNATSAAATSLAAGPTVTFAAVTEKEQGFYSNTADPTTQPTPELFSQSTISTTGGSRPHDNNMPTVVLNYIISLQGVYPQENT